MRQQSVPLRWSGPAARAVCGLLLIVSGAQPIFAATPAQVDAAIQKGKAWLESHEKSGSWEEVPAPDPKAPAYSVKGAQWTGMTALATYALICAQEKETDPHVASATEFLAKNEAHGVYAAGVRCLLWSRLENLTTQERSAAKQDVAFLVSALRSTPPARGLYYYVLPKTPKDADYDNSVSQFGVLGLWSMYHQGAEIPTSYWKVVDEAWRAEQYDDGAWSYVHKHPGPWGVPTASMTAAGVATLFITTECMHQGGDCKPAPNDPNINRGMEWLSKNFEAVFDPNRQNDKRHYEHYTLFGVSRIGVASGYKYFGNVDWFKKGADHLVSTQKPDGSWEGTVPTPAETAFGVLFLTYGSAPVVLNKLEYVSAAKGKGEPGHWNDRPQDALNFVDWMGRTLERRLNWQIVNLSSAPVEDMHDAPILFVTGDELLDFSQADRDKLKLFVEQGGLILGNADCGSVAYSKSFAKLGEELFPLYKMRELPKEHPIYNDENYRASKWKTKPRVQGLSNGVRELMLLPDADLSRAFQGRNDTMRPEIYQLADNIVLYSVDKKGLTEKGTTYVVKPDPGIHDDRSVKLARLEAGANWNPEPGGWARLAAILHNQLKVGLTIEALKPGEGKLSGFKVAHLTGTDSFKLTPPQQDEIKKFIGAGGTLILDAAGGSAAFASSAEEELAVLFGADALKALAAPLPPDSPVYNLANAKLETTIYRAFAKKVVGNLKSPRICGIQQGGRVVCFYSREDLSGGLVGEPVDGVVGYEPETATALMRNMILYSAFGH